MNSPVLDCSVVCAWLLEDENVPNADAILEQVGRGGAVAPGLWWTEVRNVLVMAERRGRLSPSQTDATLLSVGALEVALDHAPDSAVTLRLAREFKISVYDALYLELAIREQRPLATLDKALKRAAESEGVEVCL